MPDNPKRGRPRIYTDARATSYRLDADTRAAIDRLADTLGVSRAEVIRLAVREYESCIVGNGDAPATVDGKHARQR